MRITPKGQPENKHSLGAFTQFLAINSLRIPDGEFAEGPVSNSSSGLLHSAVLPLLTAGILHLFGVGQ